MDQLYALGVTCIEFIQYWFADCEGYFRIVNNLSDPRHVTEFWFPFISIVDSVFAAQLLLCMSFGGWLNTVMKWWLLEDRPYWWVRDTTFYAHARRPVLRQTRQTCETGPGSPSGHTSTAAMTLLLLLMWISHIMHDKNYNIRWWKYVLYPMFGAALVSVMLARMFAATHFPHQCLLGALVGSFLSPALCIYVSDPYIWRYGFHATYEPYKALAWHVFAAVVAILIAVITYYSLVLCGWEPHWTVKLAFRFCQYPDTISVSTTPMYSLVYSTASLLGWALSVTPAVAEYRHYTKNRSIILAVFATLMFHFGHEHIQDKLCRLSVLQFYTSQFILTALKPMLMLRVTPALARWPYSGEKVKEA